MNTLKRKFRKLFRDPKLFFKDAVLNKKYKDNFSYKNKRRTVKGKYSFVVIAPTYNVERYVKSFFISIVNQTLDFKSNLH